ncbi:cytoskeleton protein RodZ [Vibrio sp. T187]|uniref:cytoskeleton protein RodZ n=1 Tax=Vibrio TaxID=662 RepID=UPI0010C99284|nr:MULTISPECIES: cytoskeleton protein RodZ [Vibrio]MBW3697934.1 cytoskeleton protein RodZ [Vibrio sp. T187]
MNTEQDNPTPQEFTQPEAGTILKQKRESLGLTQKQIADRLKLRVSVIEQIEDNQFEVEQVATFTRGYLRSYAKSVNLDEKIVLDALDHAGDAQHQEQEMQSFSRKTKTEKHNSRIMGITWGIFAVIVGISSLWWWQNQQQDTLSQSLAASSTETEVIANEPEVDTSIIEEVVAPVIPSEETVDIVSIEPVEEVPVEVVEEPQPEVAAVVTETVTVDTPEIVEEPVAVEEVETSTIANELAMQFSADCWIQVKDATGKTLSTGIKKAGQSLKLSGTAPYKVVLGAPEGVSMTFASEPVDLSGYTSGKVARITLP